jgi:DNA-binding transcriptional LysR family regulator
VQFFGQFQPGFLVTTGNDEPGTFLRESQSCRSANAGQRTCDQDDGIAHLELRFGCSQMNSPGDLKNGPKFRTYRTWLSAIRVSRMDSLGSLNVFVQAAEARSFTVAGRQLGVSSSAIGKAVARMEERLGVRLFHRSTRSITLTAEGALFLERCRRIFSEIEAAELELSQTYEAPRGTLRISLPLAGMLMVPTLVAFMRAYPEITLDLDFSDRVVDVIDEGFDAVVRFADPGDSRLMSRALGTYRRRLVAAPGYLAVRGIPLIPDDLKAHACLLHKFPTSRKFERWPLGPEHTGTQIELPRTAVASTLEPLIYMAEQGLGIAYVPDFAIARQLRESLLVTVLDDYTDRSGPLRILWPSSRHLAPKLRVFVDFLAANLVPTIEGEADMAGDCPMGQ